MEKLSRLIGLRMLAVKEGQECGKISEVVLDVEKKVVRFFVLNTGRGCFGLKLLENALVNSTGQDYATTATAETITNFWENEEAMELNFTDADLIGARVVSNQGDVVGEIMDISLDVKSGEITNYILEGGTVLDKSSIVHIARGMVFIDAPDPGIADEPVAQMVDFISDQPAVDPMPQPHQAFAALTEMAQPSAPAPSEKQQSSPAQEEAAKQEPLAASADTPSAASLLAAAKTMASQKPKEEAAAVQDLKKTFEKRRTDFLIGRNVKQDVLDADGNVLVQKGDTVTADMVDAVKAADKLVELTMNVS